MSKTIVVKLTFLEKYFDTDKVNAEYVERILLKQGVISKRPGFGIEYEIKEEG